MAGIGVGTAFAVVAFVPTVAAGDSNPVHNTAVSTYTAVPSKGVVNVSVTLKVSNNYKDELRTYACDKPSFDPWMGWSWTPSTCESRTRIYVNQGYLWVEKNATQLKVTSSAGSVKLSRDKASTADFTAYDLTFPKIFKGQTRTLTATYVLKSGAPRSANTTRINGAYLNFYAITQPVDTASVKVVVPSAFEPATWGGVVTTSTSAKQTVYSSGNVKDPAKFGVGVYGTNPNGFNTAVVKSASGRDVQIKAWPGDSNWLKAVTSAASGSISALEGLVGRPIPGTGPVSIREVASGNLGDAYAGVYDKDVQTASISEDYDQAGLVSHELAHTWFNSAMFDSTWMSEGHAEWAARSVGQSMAPCVAPTAKVDLSNWQFADPRSTVDQRNTVSAQYDAACAIVTDAATLVGADRMKDVFTVLSTDAGAYPGTHDAKPGAPNTWRQWLDTIDEDGLVPAGKTDIAAVTDDLVKYGVASSTDLSARSAARTELTSLRAEAVNGWTIPAAVYSPMETWDFPTADKAMSQTQATIADVEAVAADLPSVTVDANPIQDQLALASTVVELSKVGDEAAAQRATAHQLATAIERVHTLNPIEAVGLIGTDINAKSTAAVASVASLDLDGAKAKIADMDGALQGAATIGLVRILAVVAAIAILSSFIWRRRRGDGTKVGSGSASDLPMTSTEPAPGMATVSLEDQPTAI